MTKAGTKAATHPFAIKHRRTGEVLFTAQLSCTPGTLPSVKLGLAVKAAVNARANLADANLADANLAGAYLADANLAGAYLADANLARANLAGANLAGADLTRAYLAGANLAGANLADANLADVERMFKADFFLTLLRAKAEVPALISALREGRVDGSQYEGECACLVGTLANARGERYKTAFPDAAPDHPAEQWFTMILKGDKAGDDSGGGFAAAKALEWALEFCALNDILAAEAEAA